MKYFLLALFITSSINASADVITESDTGWVQSSYNCVIIDHEVKDIKFFADSVDFLWAEVTIEYLCQDIEGEFHKRTGSNEVLFKDVWYQIINRKWTVDGTWIARRSGFSNIYLNPAYDIWIDTKQQKLFVEFCVQFLEQ